MLQEETKPTIAGPDIRRKPSEVEPEFHRTGLKGS